MPPIETPSPEGLGNLIETVVTRTVQTLAERGVVPANCHILNMEQAAEYCGIHKMSIQKLVTSGDLKVKMYGRRVLIPVEECDRWIASLPERGAAK